MRLSQVAEWTGGSLQGEAYLTGVSTDSRSLEPGSLFIALRGPRFDGHQFIPEARDAGAAAVLVAAGTGTYGLPAVTVSDTGQALLALGAAWRARSPAQVIAVTGSCGKTTVKEMLSAILGSPQCWATPANWNNWVGAPLTLLGLRGQHRFGVVELGINYAGEMRPLATAVQPEIAVVTNATAAHLEGLGSPANVAAEKGQVFACLPAHGVAVVNADSPYAQRWAIQSSGQVLRFGLDSPADLQGDWSPSPKGGVLEIATTRETDSVELTMPGRHNGANALAAATVAYSLGIPMATITAGLARLGRLSGRLQEWTGPGGLSLLDDTYNANPASLEAALDVLSQEVARSWLVLGDMAELGGESAAWHRWAGEQARAYGVKRLLGIGPLARYAVSAFGDGGVAVTHWEEAATLLTAEAGGGDRVLIKGSRSMRLERLVKRLLAGVA